MASSPEQQLATMIGNMPEKTGKNLDQWLKLLNKHNFAKHGEIIKFLKGEHGVTHGFANLIASQALAAANSSKDDLVAAQYRGDKAALKDIYDELEQLAKALGKDVEIAPKKSYVSLRRNKQFALVQASTKSRVDLGLNLKGKAESDRLEKAGSFNAMVSHRVRLSSKNEVDDEIRAWLKEAYSEA